MSSRLTRFDDDITRAGLLCARARDGCDQRPAVPNVALLLLLNDHGL